MEVEIEALHQNSLFRYLLVNGWLVANGYTQLSLTLMDLLNDCLLGC
jgi:hypothetical protein